MVEDDPGSRELAEVLLEAAGHRVEVARDGAAFRAWLSTGAAADLILMDIRLPDTAGDVLLGELQAASGSKPPVVALTAHALAGDRERLLALGFVGVITKPLDTRAFVQQVEAQHRAARGGA